MGNKKKQNKRDDVKARLKEVKPTGALKEFVPINNPVVSGGINYYGKFCASELCCTMQYIDSNLIRWAKKKYDKIGNIWRKRAKWLNGIKSREPTLFRHWQ